MVAASLAAGVLIGPAAILAVVAGAATVAILHSELRQTRTAAAADRAAQARDYEGLLESRDREHVEFASAMQTRVREQQGSIDLLGGSLATAQRRYGEAEARAAKAALRASEADTRLTLAELRADAAAERLDSERRRADQAEARLHDESQRARQAQQQLANVLDEVFGTTLYDADDDRPVAGRDNVRALRPVLDVATSESRRQA